MVNKSFIRGGPCGTVAVEKVLHYCSTHLWLKTHYLSYHTWLHSLDRWKATWVLQKDKQVCFCKLRVYFSRGGPIGRQGWPLSADNMICRPFAQFTWWQSLRNSQNQKSFFKHMVISSWLGRSHWYMGLTITKFWGKWGLKLSQKWNDCVIPLKKLHQTWIWTH